MVIYDDQPSEILPLTCLQAIKPVLKSMGWVSKWPSANLCYGEKALSITQLEEEERPCLDEVLIVSGHATERERKCAVEMELLQPALLKNIPYSYGWVWKMIQTFQHQDSERHHGRYNVRGSATWPSSLLLFNNGTIYSPIIFRFRLLWTWQGCGLCIGLSQPVAGMCPSITEHSPARGEQGKISVL